MGVRILQWCLRRLRHHLQGSPSCGLPHLLPQRPGPAGLRTSGGDPLAGQHTVDPLLVALCCAHPNVHIVTRNPHLSQGVPRRTRRRPVFKPICFRFACTIRFISLGELHFASFFLKNDVSLCTMYSKAQKRLAIRISCTKKRPKDGPWPEKVFQCYQLVKE